MATLINMTAHQLTDEQKESAIEFYGIKSFKEFKDLNLELFNKIANSPDTNHEIESLAHETIEWIRQIQFANLETCYFHLPIGSPAFMFIFGSVWGVSSKINILFSHSERVSTEVHSPDGTVKKENIFKFIKFIEI